MQAQSVVIHSSVSLSISIIYCATEAPNTGLFSINLQQSITISQARQEWVPVILLGNVPTAPPLKLKEDHSHIMYWSQEDFNCAESKQVSGETSGDVSTNNTASPQEPQDNYTKYYYLQHDDGTHISKKEVAHLSFDACAHWTTGLHSWNRNRHHQHSVGCQAVLGNPFHDQFCLIQITHSCTGARTENGNYKSGVHRTTPHGP